MRLLFQHTSPPAAETPVAEETAGPGKKMTAQEIVRRQSELSNELINACLAHDHVAAASILSQRGILRAQIQSKMSSYPEGDDARAIHAIEADLAILLDHMLRPDLSREELTADMLKKRRLFAELYQLLGMRPEE